MVHTAAFMFILTFVLVAPGASHSKTAESLVFSAKIYKKDSKKKELLFEQKNYKKKVNGTEYSRSIFHQPGDESKVAVEEEFEKTKNGFSRYMIFQKQLNEKWVVERNGNKINFRKVKFSDKKSSDESENLVKNFVLGPMTMDYLREKENWQGLLKGESVKVRFGVPARQETVGFKFFKDSEVKINGRKALKVIMKPSNFLISALVDPIEFYIDAENRNLLEIIGRTLPRKNVAGKWKDLDAHIVYNHMPTSKKK